MLFSTSVSEIWIAYYSKGFDKIEETLAAYCGKSAEAYF
jgi:hypothetical protein